MGCGEGIGEGCFKILCMGATAGMEKDSYVLDFGPPRLQIATRRVVLHCPVLSSIEAGKFCWSATSEGTIAIIVLGYAILCSAIDLNTGFTLQRSARLCISVFMGCSSCGEFW